MLHIGGEQALFLIERHAGFAAQFVEMKLDALFRLFDGGLQSGVESSDLFSGLLWTGARSIELGLSDGFGSVDFVAREVIKAEDIFDYTKKQDFTERFAKRFGAVMAGALAKVLTQGQVNIR